MHQVSWIKKYYLKYNLPEKKQKYWEESTENDMLKFLKLPKKLPS